MKVSVLQSSSEGNMTYVETSNHKLLIDVGKIYKRAQESLSNINKELDDIDTILITHCHSDHVGCLNTIFKRHKAQIYMNQKAYNEWQKSEINYIPYEKQIIIDNITITCLPLSHDVICYGFLIEDGITSLVYITDTGYISSKNLELIKNKNIYIIESNHDVDLEMQGNKLYNSKIRNIGDQGHLSNEQCGKYLKKIIGPKTKNIVLAHISEDDNDYDLAFSTVTNIINNDAIKVNIAKKKDNKSVIIDEEVIKC